MGYTTAMNNQMRWPNSVGNVDSLSNSDNSNGTGGSGSGIGGSGGGGALALTLSDSISNLQDEPEVNRNEYVRDDNTVNSSLLLGNQAEMAQDHAGRHDRTDHHRYYVQETANNVATNNFMNSSEQQQQHLTQQQQQQQQQQQHLQLIPPWDSTSFALNFSRSSNQTRPQTMDGIDTSTPTNAPLFQALHSSTSADSSNPSSSSSSAAASALSSTSTTTSSKGTVPSSDSPPSSLQYRLMDRSTSRETSLQIDRVERRQMVETIVAMLKQARPRAPSMYLDKLPNLASRLEKMLYRTAKTKEQYADRFTLARRLEHVHKVTKNSQHLLQSRNQGVVSSSPPSSSTSLLFGEGGNDILGHSSNTSYSGGLKRQREEMLLSSNQHGEFPTRSRSATDYNTRKAPHPHHSRASRSNSSSVSPPFSYDRLASRKQKLALQRRRQHIYDFVDGKITPPARSQTPSLSDTESDDKKTTTEASSVTGSRDSLTTTTTTTTSTAALRPQPWSNSIMAGQATYMNEKNVSIRHDDNGNDNDDDGGDDDDNEADSDNSSATSDDRDIHAPRREKFSDYERVSGSNQGQHQSQQQDQQQQNYQGGENRSIRSSSFADSYRDAEYGFAKTSRKLFSGMQNTSSGKGFHSPMLSVYYSSGHASRNPAEPPTFPGSTNELDEEGSFDSYRTSPLHLDGNLQSSNNSIGTGAGIGTGQQVSFDNFYDQQPSPKNDTTGIQRGESYLRRVDPRDDLEVGKDSSSHRQGQAQQMASAPSAQEWMSSTPNGARTKFSPGHSGGFGISMFSFRHGNSKSRTLSNGFMRASRDQTKKTRGTRWVFTKSDLDTGFSPEHSVKKRCISSAGSSNEDSEGDDSEGEDEEDGSENNANDNDNDNDNDNGDGDGDGDGDGGGNRSETTGKNNVTMEQNTPKMSPVKGKGKKFLGFSLS